MRLVRDIPVGTPAWKRIYHRARNAVEARNFWQTRQGDISGLGQSIWGEKKNVQVTRKTLGVFHNPKRLSRAGRGLVGLAGLSLTYGLSFITSGR